MVKVIAKVRPDGYIYYLESNRYVDIFVFCHNVIRTTIQARGLGHRSSVPYGFVVRDIGN